jgi:hypothetical protein
MGIDEPKINSLEFPGLILGKKTKKEPLSIHTCYVWSETLRSIYLENTICPILGKMVNETFPREVHLAQLASPPFKFEPRKPYCV